MTHRNNIYVRIHIQVVWKTLVLSLDFHMTESALQSKQSTSTRSVLLSTSTGSVYSLPVQVKE